MSYVISLSDAVGAVATTRPFRAGSMTGADEDGAYVVRSYGVEIARQDPATGEHYVTATKYSQTTSKHTNIVRRAWAADWKGYLPKGEAA